MEPNPDLIHPDLQSVFDNSSVNFDALDKQQEVLLDPQGDDDLFYIAQVHQNEMQRMAALSGLDIHKILGFYTRDTLNDQISPGLNRRLAVTTFKLTALNEAYRTSRPYEGKVEVTGNFQGFEFGRTLGAETIIVPLSEPRFIDPELDRDIEFLPEIDSVMIPVAEIGRWSIINRKN